MDEVLKCLQQASVVLPFAIYPYVQNVLIRYTVFPADPFERFRVSYGLKSRIDAVRHNEDLVWIRPQVVNDLLLRVLTASDHRIRPMRGQRHHAPVIKARGA